VDDHEVRDDWGPASWCTRACGATPAARGARLPRFHEFMPMRETLVEPGRIYRKIAYGPLLDVFMLDMRSYRGPNGAVAPATAARPRACGRQADRLGSSASSPPPRAPGR